MRCTDHPFREAILTDERVAESLQKAHVVLDVGAGECSLLDLLRDLSVRVDTYIAVDVCPDTRDFKRNPSVFSINRVRARAESLPIRSDSVDVCLSINVTPYFDDVGRALSEMSRATKPGGMMILVCPVQSPYWLRFAGGRELELTKLDSSLFDEIGKVLTRKQVVIDLGNSVNLEIAEMVIVERLPNHQR